MLGLSGSGGQCENTTVYQGVRVCVCVRVCAKPCLSGFDWGDTMYRQHVPSNRPQMKLLARFPWELVWAIRAKETHPPTTSDDTCKTWHLVLSGHSALAGGSFDSAIQSTHDVQWHDTCMGRKLSSPTRIDCSYKSPVVRRCVVPRFQTVHRHLRDSPVISGRCQWTLLTVVFFRWLHWNTYDYKSSSRCYGPA